MKKTLTLIILIILYLNNYNVVFAQWQQTNGPYGGNINSIAASGSKLFASNTVGGVFISTNSGTNWNTFNNGLTNKNVDVLCASGSNIFAGTSSGGIFLS